MHCCYDCRHRWLPFFTILLYFVSSIHIHIYHIQYHIWQQGRKYFTSISTSVTTSIWDFTQASDVEVEPVLLCSSKLFTGSANDRVQGHLCRDGKVKLWYSISNAMHNKTIEIYFFLPAWHYCLVIYSHFLIKYVAWKEKSMHKTLITVIKVEKKNRLNIRKQ